jgi:hypothetical protein
MQSRRQSMIEVGTNTAVGMAGSWVISYASIVTIDDHAMAAAVAVAGCTIWSLVRGYWIRRRFASLEKS